MQKPLKLSWRPWQSDPPPADGRRILAWGKYTMDEYDEDDNRIARGKVSYAPTILHSMPPFEGWAEFGRRYVQNAEYVFWQDIVPPEGHK